MRAQKVVRVVIINTFFFENAALHPQRQFPFDLKPPPKKFKPDPSTPGHAKAFLVRPIRNAWGLRRYTSKAASLIRQLLTMPEYFW